MTFSLFVCFRYGFQPWCSPLDKINHIETKFALPNNFRICVPQRKAQIPFNFRSTHSFPPQGAVQYDMFFEAVLKGNLKMVSKPCETCIDVFSIPT